MKQRTLCQLLVFYLLMNVMPCAAQALQDVYMLSDNIETLLPPLEAIIDSALAKSPDVKAKEHSVTVKEYALKTEKIRWTENLGIQADGRYGTFDNFSMNTGVGQTPSSTSTRNNQFNYGVGAYIKLPFFDFMNRRKIIGATKGQIEEAKSLAAVQRDLLRQLVIKQYQDVILKQRLLTIKSKRLETSKINMMMAEKEFQSRITTLSEYSRIADITATAEVEFESAKIEFITAFMMLEEISKTKLELKKKN